MEQLYHLGATTAAGTLSVAPLDYPIIWVWFLLAAVMALCIRLQEQSQFRLKAIPVLSRTRRLTRRTHPGVRQ